MHKATKAALISALVFPGCGHFYLKSKLRGAVFTLFSVGCLYVLLTYAVQIANDISERIVSGDIPLNVNSLMAEISSQLNGSAGDPAHIATILLLICWGVAIIDSFILGRKLMVPVISH
ncbi:hypothetical protein [Paraglaciecola arctica]|uniref:Uncharacterized protein n=1 Tax=Paraglaciecola arctica BSs20135 TaxID=493475 RepID=K6XHU7_9ALTE|nr:hypothetical protein [Paraglaciecola arctica]GAC20229.1 hypothetical protein GARC_3270 [Paraglaciecola arctica BSs20135]